MKNSSWYFATIDISLLVSTIFPILPIFSHLTTFINLLFYLLFFIFYQIRQSFTSPVIFHILPIFSHLTTFINLLSTFYLICYFSYFTNLSPYLLFSIFSQFYQSFTLPVIYLSGFISIWDQWWEIIHRSLRFSVSVNIVARVCNDIGGIWRNFYICERRGRRGEISRATEESREKMQPK